MAKWIAILDIHLRWKNLSIYFNKFSTFWLIHIFWEEYRMGVTSKKKQNVVAFHLWINLLGISYYVSSAGTKTLRNPLILGRIVEMSHKFPIFIKITSVIFLFNHCLLSHMLGTIMVLCRGICSCMCRKYMAHKISKWHHSWNRSWVPPEYQAQ